MSCDWRNALAGAGRAAGGHLVWPAPLVQPRRRAVRSECVADLPAAGLARGRRPWVTVERKRPATRPPHALDAPSLKHAGNMPDIQI